MKVVILAGGMGTRIARPGIRIPKPLVEVDGKPILFHIMRSFASQGYTDFVVALGYEGNQIKDYFMRLMTLELDIRMELSSGRIEPLTNHQFDWKVTLIETGIDTMTGGRLRRLKHLLTDSFFLTYGDGVSDVPLSGLLAHHNRSRALATITAVNPTSRYGELSIDQDGRVTAFNEKPEFSDHWINGGFMVLEPSIIDLIGHDNSVLEADVLPLIAAQGKLAAFKHEGFWHCMDTLRDKNELDKLAASGEYPWLRSQF